MAYKCIEALKTFCKENNYEIVSSCDCELMVKVRGDMWKMTAVSDDKCTLLHLNQRGKMQWHRQGKYKYYGLSYITNCLKYHNTYSKEFKAERKRII